MHICQNVLWKRFSFLKSLQHFDFVSVDMVVEVVAQVRLVQVVNAPFEASNQLAVSVAFNQPKIINDNPAVISTDFTSSRHLSFSPPFELRNRR